MIWFLLVNVWKFLLPKHLSLRIFGGNLLLELGAICCISCDSRAAQHCENFFQQAYLLVLSLLLAWSLQLFWLAFSFMIVSFILIVLSIKVVFNEIVNHLILFTLWVRTWRCLLANDFGKLFHLILVRPLRLHQQILSYAARTEINRGWFIRAMGSNFLHILKLWRFQNYLVLKGSKRRIFQVCRLIKNRDWQRLLFLCFFIKTRCS